MQRLTDIGFIFHAKKCMTFEERLQQWVEFREQNNGKDPERCSSDGLSKWVRKLRERKWALDEGKKTSLTREQVDRLTALHFRWSSLIQLNREPDPLSWDECFEELKLYPREHFNPPPQNTAVGRWCQCQRKFFRQLFNGETISIHNTMTAQQIAKLNSVEGWQWTSTSSRPRPRHTDRGTRNDAAARLKRDDDDDEDDDESDSTDEDGNDDDDEE
jgi:Helicase associated domain